MADLFSDAADDLLARNAPLAARMRPRTLDEFVGQEHAVGPGTALRAAIERDELSSLILYGPAGCGKTSLARVIANTTSAEFTEVSAVSSGVADIRKAIEEARTRLSFQGRRTTLFIDEIHRFSKSQQDALLHAVEDGVVTLIGASTENPYFEVIPALISRCELYQFEPLSKADIRLLLDRFLDNGQDHSEPKGSAVSVPDPVRDLVARGGLGDARRAYAILERSLVLARSQGSKVLDEATVERAAQRKLVLYDKGADAHYDVISAFIKSMRGSDPDAALYYLAVMLTGGEDPKFIARRMVIFASEDVSNADPEALAVAVAVSRAVEFVGLPECRINLAQGVTYLACAPKSNASYVGLESAMAEVRDQGALAPPVFLRSTGYSGAKDLGHGVGYEYPHDSGGYVAQRYLPKELWDREFYRPAGEGREKTAKELLERMRSLRRGEDDQQPS